LNIHSFNTYWPKASYGPGIMLNARDRGGLVRGTQIAFAKKHWLLTWAHELTKNRKSLPFLPPFCICLCSKLFSLQSLCSHLGFQKGQNW
jgi:hypothetical protein